MKSTDLVPYEGGGTDVPGVTVPLQMYTHLALTGDLAQHKAWRERLERLEQLAALESTSNREQRAAISHKGLWKSIRRASWWAASYTTVLGSLLTAELIREYAVGWGFGWLESSAYILPVPLAFMVARRLYQKGSVSVAAKIGPAPSPAKWVRGILRSLSWSFASGFGFGFTLLFLQGLISWFFTPAPTLGLELYADCFDAVVAGGVLGVGSMGSFWLLCRKVPSDTPALPDGSS